MLLVCNLIKNHFVKNLTLAVGSKIFNISTGMIHFRHFLSILLLLFLCKYAWCETNEISVSAEPVSCYGKSDGKIKVILGKTISENFEILLFDSLSKQITSINEGAQQPLVISDLKAGKYAVQITVKGKNSTYPAEIKSPGPLKANSINIEEIRGKDETTRAIIKANPSGGTPPYIVEWSENTNDQKGLLAKELPMGVYRCMINDKNNCGPVSATIFLFETEIEKFLSSKNQ
jgi:hypothetical protein